MHYIIVTIIYRYLITCIKNNQIKCESATSIENPTASAWRQPFQYSKINVSTKNKWNPTYSYCTRHFRLGNLFLSYIMFSSKTSIHQYRASARQGRIQAGRGRNYRREGPRADICAPLPLARKLFSNFNFIWTYTLSVRGRR